MPTSMPAFMYAASSPQDSYALFPHLAHICPEPEAWASSRWLALIDAGQQPGLAERVVRPYRPEQITCLYKDTFAENVLQLSPLLIELSANQAEGFDEIKRLDARCAQWPITSLIQTQETAARWLMHLRTLLRLEMDGTPYLWRLADTQMLHATISVLNPDQRAMLLSPCQSWWMANDEGLAQDLAVGLPSTRAALAPASLQLDGAQEKALLMATAAPALRSQLRTLAPDFGSSLSHFEQSSFARACVDEAREALIDEDTELLDWALARWHQQASTAGAEGASRRCAQP